MICEFGDVVVVPFPFVDQPVVKRRPALVLSSTAFNRGNGQTVFAMITTAGGSAWPTDIAIARGSGAGLEHASIIRWKLFTLPNTLILKHIGKLAEPDRALVVAAVRQTIAPS